MRYIRTPILKRPFSLRRQSFDDREESQESDASKPENFQKPKWKCLSYEEIHAATNGFCPDNMVGKGGFAEVYRGVLADGQAIAVKRLTKSTNDERKEKEFLTEIGTRVLSNFPVLIKGLRGFSSPRYKIGVGTGRGLHYVEELLHTKTLKETRHGCIN